MIRLCGICKRELDNPLDPFSGDCGGDCVKCMADAGDPDCIESVNQIINQLRPPRELEVFARRKAKDFIKCIDPNCPINKQWARLNFKDHQPHCHPVFE